MIVIYDKKTRRVLVTEENGVYTLPEAWELAEIDDDQPALVDVNGSVFLKENSTIKTKERNYWQ